MARTRNQKSSESTVNAGPVKGRGRVEVGAGLNEPTIYDFAVIDTSGDSVALTAQIPSTNGGEFRHRRVDRLISATMTTHPTYIEYRGISEMLRSTVGTSSEDSIVVWKLFPEGCQDCDA